MIPEWFMGVASGLMTFFADLLPDWELPADLADPDGMLAAIFALGAGAGAFVDWVFVAAVGAVPLSVWIIGLLWKAARMAFSHFPGFGGSG